MKSRTAFSAEYRLRSHDGAYRWVLNAATPWFGSDGGFVGFIGSVIDIAERREIEQMQRELNQVLEERVAEAIAERKQAEAQLHQVQKMEAVGRLTGGIAHDFNNLLQVIGGNLELLKRDVEGREKAERRLQSAIAGVTRGAKMASQLLAFGRRQPLDPKVINLGRLVRSLDDMLRRALGEGIEIETVIAGGLWNTMADPSQVENAILNLAINARDAMEGHGKLTIEAGNASLDDVYAAKHDVAPGQYVMLAVTDTGCGIAPELMEQIFEPFFTTKPEGQGTGLGLSMVYGFVKQSGGHIKVYSERDAGTTFRIYLPRSFQDEEAAAEISAGPIENGTETILVVEDDEKVRATVVDMLTSLGYRVLKAKDAQSAFAIVESGAPMDLLFTDVVMPGPMRSTELAKRAKERLPGLAVLFTSGYTDNAIVHGGRLDHGVDLLSKPYTREALARKIRHCLNNRRQLVVKQANGLAKVSAAAEASRQLRVLLVEDEPLIRQMAADMLAELGHRVTEAGTVKAALAQLGGQPFDVLVADVSLPDGTGVDLAVRARRIDIGLKVLFATGDGSVPQIATQEELQGAIVVAKPYNSETLAESLRALVPISKGSAHSGLSRRV